MVLVYSQIVQLSPKSIQEPQPLGLFWMFRQAESHPVGPSVSAALTEHHVLRGPSTCVSVRASPLFLVETLRVEDTCSLGCVGLVAVMSLAAVDACAGHTGLCGCVLSSPGVY